MTQDYIFWVFQVPLGIVVWVATIALIVGVLKIANIIKETTE